MHLVSRLRGDETRHDLSELRRRACRATNASGEQARAISGLHRAKTSTGKMRSGGMIAPFALAAALTQAPALPVERVIANPASVYCIQQGGR